MEQGFTSHAISLPLAWNRVPPDALQREVHLDGAIGWAIEDQLRLASGRKLVLLGQQLMHVLTVTQSLGPLQRQREVEAYALQSQSGMVESLLARHC